MARVARNIVLDRNRQILKRKSLQELSDAELRKYKFRVASPETTLGYDRSRPEENDVFVAIIHDYDIPHKKNSNKAYAWCAICQKYTHYYGGLALYDDEKVRSVGWQCCANRLDVDLKEGWEKFKQAKVRVDRLDQFETLSALMPEVVRETEDIKDHVSFHVFNVKREEFKRNFPPLWNWLSTIAFHGDGWVEYEVELIDYSGTALHREDGEDHGGSKLKGQKMRREKARARVDGWQFVHPNSDLGNLRNKALQIAMKCAEFFSWGHTDVIDGKTFAEMLREVRRLVKLLEQLENISTSLRPFFDRANRERIVGLRNRSLAEQAYSITRNGIRWRPPDSEAVELVSPKNYSPINMRSLGRLRRAIK